MGWNRTQKGIFNINTTIHMFSLILFQIMECNIPNAFLIPHQIDNFRKKSVNKKLFLWYHFKVLEMAIFIVIFL